MRRFIPFLGLLIVLAACGGATSEAQPGPTSVPSSPPESTIARPDLVATASLAPSIEVVPSPELPVEGSVIPSDLLQAMISDLAVRLNRDPAAIRVQSSEAVTWSDSSLGCPEPGVMYMQVLIDGYRAVLVSADNSYSYHASIRGDFLWCENAQP